MPGIVGIVDSQECSFPSQRIRSMMQPLRRQDWHTAHTAETPRAVFGSVQIEPQADRLADLLILDLVRKWVDSHISGQRNDYIMLCGLMTLILWQKMFIDGDLMPLGNREALFARLTETVI